MLQKQAYDTRNYAQDNQYYANGMMAFTVRMMTLLNACLNGINSPEGPNVNVAVTPDVLSRVEEVYREASSLNDQLSRVVLHPDTVTSARKHFEDVKKFRDVAYRKASIEPGSFSRGENAGQLQAERARRIEAEQELLHQQELYRQAQEQLAVAQLQKIIASELKDDLASGQFKLEPVENGFRLSFSTNETSTSSRKVIKTLRKVKENLRDLDDWIADFEINDNQMIVRTHNTEATALLQQSLESILLPAHQVSASKFSM